MSRRHFTINMNVLQPITNRTDSNRPHNVSICVISNGGTSSSHMNVVSAFRTHMAESTCGDKGVNVKQALVSWREIREINRGVGHVVFKNICSGRSNDVTSVRCIDQALRHHIIPQFTRHQITYSSRTRPDSTQAVSRETSSNITTPTGPKKTNWFHLYNEHVRNEVLHSLSQMKIYIHIHT